MRLVYISCACVLILVCILPSQCLRLNGKWRSKRFFNFLARFGFQQTDMKDDSFISNTQGYIYGNITSADNPKAKIMLVVVDSEYFLEYYRNRTASPKNTACFSMFKKIDTKAWDPKCNQTGPEDFLRKVPCPTNELCEEESVAAWVFPGFQFTFRITDKHRPRFWYISLVSCFHNPTGKRECVWIHNDQDMVLHVDIWFVNGHPFKKHINPFEHQFSFEMHDIFEIYLAFLIAYCFLVPVQCYALHRQKHLLPVLLTSCMCMEFLGVILNEIHVLKFAFDGEGIDMFKVVGNFIDNCAQCLFMLLLLLIVKGWTITRMTLTFREQLVVFSMWTTYTMASMGLFIWNLIEVDIISDKDEWQTRPGYLILAFRIAIMIWFLIELRSTSRIEASREQNDFYLHFGAGFLVWFVYLPIVALILSQISALWRFKTMTSVMLSADFLSYCVMVHLLWPTRSQLHFHLTVESQLPLDDLDLSDSHKYSKLAIADSDSETELLDTTSFIATTNENARLIANATRPKVPNGNSAVVNGSVPHRGRECENGRTCSGVESQYLSESDYGSDTELFAQNR